MAQHRALLVLRRVVAVVVAARHLQLRATVRIMAAAAAAVVLERAGRVLVGKALLLLPMPS
jgi:hypothetical protein